MCAVSIAELLQAGPLLSRELLKNCKDQTQQDCTSAIPENAKVFHWPWRKQLSY
jgi:hypothetical protein